MIIVPHLIKYKGSNPNSSDNNPFDFLIVVLFQILFLIFIWKVGQNIHIWAPKLLKFETILIGMIVAGFVGGIMGYKDRK